MAALMPHPSAWTKTVLRLQGIRLGAMAADRGLLNTLQDCNDYEFWRIDWIPNTDVGRVWAARILNTLLQGVA
jgi:hypothetical protein